MKRKRGCKQCGSNCGVLHCQVCAKRWLCEKCKAQNFLARIPKRKPHFVAIGYRDGVV